MKTCRICKETKQLPEFHKSSSNKDGLDSRCKACRKTDAANNYREKWFHWTAKLKKSYCKHNTISFDLTAEYLESIWTENCPVFHKPFELFDKASDFSPSLDRFNPLKGYVQGNVQYISARANRIKYNASIEELECVIKYMEGATTIPKGSTLQVIGSGSAEPLI